MLIDHPPLIRKRSTYGRWRKIGVDSGESHFIPSLCSFPRLLSAPLCRSERGFSPLEMCPAADVSFSLLSTHCSRKRPRVTATLLGLHISPASMGTLLSVIHTLFHAAFPDPNGGLNSQEEEDPVQRWGGSAEMSG